jgi:hypothetical protein
VCSGKLRAARQEIDGYPDLERSMRPILLQDERLRERFDEVRQYGGCYVLLHLALLLRSRRKLDIRALLRI